MSELVEHLNHSQESLRLVWVPYYQLNLGTALPLGVALLNGLAPLYA